VAAAALHRRRARSIRRPLSPESPHESAPVRDFRIPLRTLYAHGGGELPVSNTVTLNAEIGAHIVGDNFVRTNGVLLGEVVIRVKVGL
jgi:hypothetical protein